MWFYLIGNGDMIQRISVEAIGETVPGAKEQVAIMFLTYYIAQ